jgi:uncharacterized membrane protein YdbT with pleckstrin-like domain
VPESTSQPLAAASNEPERVLFEGPPALIPSIGALLITVLTLGLALIVFVIRQRATRYRVTTERVVVERGLFSKRIEQIDIYRINDYVVELPFSQRLMGTGNLVLEAMDKTTPHIHLTALGTDVRALYEELRKATEIQKRVRGVRVVDYE